MLETLVGTGQVPHREWSLCLPVKEMIDYPFDAKYRVSQKVLYPFLPPCPQAGLTPILHIVGSTEIWDLHQSHLLVKLRSAFAVSVFFHWLVVTIEDVTCEKMDKFFIPLISSSI